MLNGLWGQAAYWGGVFLFLCFLLVMAIGVLFYTVKKLNGPDH